MKPELHFNKSYLTVLDSLLDYSGPCQREDFLTLLHIIESSMRFHPNHDRGFFENNKVRDIFGRVRMDSKPDLIWERIQDFFSNSIITTTNILYGSAQEPNSNTTNILYGSAQPQNRLKKKRVWKLDLIIKQLTESGVLVASDYSYSKKKTREYWYSPYFNMLLDGKKTKLTKGEVHPKYYTQIKKESKPVSPQANAQYELLISDRFTIDDEKALEWINDHYINAELSGNQRLSAERMVLDMKDKNIFASFGPKSNRITTSFTSMKRELRQFCKLDGEELDSVDLKSSQPYILATYFKKVNPIETETFYDDVVHNDIYSIFLNHARTEGLTKFKVWNGAYMEDKEIRDREETKPEFLKMMFKESGRKPMFTQVLEKYYPDLYEVFIEYKQDLAAKLQREESNIFIPVCDEFVSEGCLSVHDSLYFRPEMKERVLERLTSRLESFGYKDYVLR